MTALVPLASAALAEGEGLVAGFGVFVFLIWGIGILATIFWLWMLVDCLTSSIPTNEKILWALVIIFTHLLGALIYFFVKRSASRPAALT